MKLSEIQQKILKPFVDKTIESLSLMAGLEAHAGEGFVDDIEKFKFKGYAVVSETEGAISGKILMHHYVETALEIGNKVRAELLDDDTRFTELNEELGDALAEFGNTAIGLAMNDLAKSELGIVFKPPYFFNDTRQVGSLMENVTEIISVPIHIDDIGRFYFNYLICGESESPSLSKDAKILIVDDMKMIRTSIKSYLKKLGYENIIEAADGKEAVEKHATEEPDFIFMDIIMPNMQGNEALKIIRENDKNVPIVMLTSVNDEETMSLCEKEGVKGYVLKPLTRESGPEVLGKLLKN